MPLPQNPTDVPHARKHRVPLFACAWALGGVLCAVLCFAVRVEAPSVQKKAAAAPFVSLELEAADNGALGENAALFDSGPLFLPTRRNAGRALSPFELPSGGAPAPFGDFGPKIALGSGALASLAAESRLRSAVAAPEQLLSARYTDFIAQFGQRGGAARAPDRAALLRVSRNGETVSEVAVGGVLPKALKNRLWAPVDYLIMVDENGVVAGEPLALGSSGDEAVDAVLRGWVRAHAGDGRLGRGLFRARIMP